ncbi:ATP-binding cassette sub-family G member 1-like isoform X2 [Phymastichus coffea]|uniref:ATP-binding cassette sub-family G member 1-like isoform X2 n=1 Tax=Phymastichus coffea TaxID=108790 RepID=UPI00273CACEA|nr:ATP-binding cassette sub-family G member 1-like isoform X2 [Phymastichus coffea]
MQNFETVLRCEQKPFDQRKSTFHTMNITFADLSYSVRTSVFTKERKQLLSNVCGDFRSGELTAIMGPSGAGKSTLMDILAGITTLNVTGSIQVNGIERDVATFRRSSAYIMQDDNLQVLLSVQEAMDIAADLKLDISTHDKQRVINGILKELGLDVARQTLTKCLSGGQRKRLSIALELISNPPIMFLDEPTSGLDSVTSHQCFELMKSLARQGRTIVCTVHQPSAMIFEMIDHLYVIAQGHCVYAGSPANVVIYLKGLGLRCPTYHNPADYLLEVTSGEHGDHLTQLANTSANGKRHEWRKYSVMSIDHKYGSTISNAIGSWRQISTLMRCNATKLSRDKILTYARLSISFFVALLTGTACYGQGKDAANVLYNIGLLSFTEQFLMFLSMNNSLIFFSLELPTLRREYFNRWYTLHSYFLANRLADLPIELIAITSYSVVIYFLSGQPHDSTRLGMFLLSLVLVCLVSQAIGLLIGACFTVRTAAILGPIAVVPAMLLSGFFVQPQDVQRPLKWLFDLSFCKYARDGLIYAMYGLDRPRMACSETEYCHFSSPKVVLKAFDATHVNYWFSMSVMCGFYVVLNAMAYFALRLRLKIQFQ